MNRIFKLSASVAVALLALAACTDDFLSLEKPGVSPSSNNQSLPLGTIRMKSGVKTRGNVIITDSLKKVEATAYTDITKNEFKFEKYLFDQKNNDGYFICEKNPQWPGLHRYRKPNDDGSYPEGTADEEKIPEKYSEWKDKPFDQAVDDKYAKAQEDILNNKNVNTDDIPTGYVYLEDYREPDWLYIVDYKEPSTLEVFVYTPPLNELREAFTSGTQGKPGSTGTLIGAPVQVYDFFNTYQEGVGLTPPVNYNEQTEYKIFYDEGVAQPGYKLGMFHAAQDISRQVDFMTGQIKEPRKIHEKTEKDEKGNDVKVYTFNPVNVELRHRLCNIEVKAKNSNPNYDVDVAGVMLGRPMVYGPMFNFNTDEWEYPPLDRNDLYSVTTYAYAPADAKNPVGDYIHRLGDNAVSLMGNGGNALVLPTTLEPWDYTNPDNQDGYNFNDGRKQIMFMAALIRVLPKNSADISGSIKFTEMMYPFGKPSATTEWTYYPNIVEGGAWKHNGNWTYKGKNCWEPHMDEIWVDDGYWGAGDWQWEAAEEVPYWKYWGDGDQTKDPYVWLLNWKIDANNNWIYIGQETHADWEMIDLSGEAYWKYNGNYVFNPETGEWEAPDIIFPSKYVIEHSHFETQEFCVVKNGYPDESVIKPGSHLPPDYVIDMRYNDRDKCFFTQTEKDDIIAKINAELNSDLGSGTHTERPDSAVITCIDDIQFQTYAWVAFPVGVDWKQGHKYTYTLDFTDGLGVEIPNGIFGGRLISDIVKSFEEREASEKEGQQTDSPATKPQRKMKSAKLPQSWGSVEVESSVWEPDDIVIKK